MAIASATGAISAAVAALEMNRPSAVVITNNVTSTRRGAAPPTSASTASAAQINPAGSLQRNRKGQHPDNRIRVFQLIEP